MTSFFNLTQGSSCFYLKIPLSFHVKQVVTKDVYTRLKRKTNKSPHLQTKILKYTSSSPSDINLSFTFPRDVVRIVRKPMTKMTCE